MNNFDDFLSALGLTRTTAAGNTRAAGSSRNTFPWRRIALILGVLLILMCIFFIRSCSVNSYESKLDEKEKIIDETHLQMSLNATEIEALRKGKGKEF